MKISDEQIAAYAKGAGVTGGNVAIAVAVALAESSGDTNSHNALPPDDSYGLWQINMLGSLGPSRRAQFGITTNTQLFDPAVNAKAMAILSSQGTNWKPWSTYTSGKYRFYLPRGETAAGTSASVETVGLSDTFSNIGALADTLSNPKTWVRVSMALGGLILVLIGIFRITGAGKVVGKAINIVPAGRALTVAKSVAGK
jgi:hypothetical protein